MEESDSMNDVMRKIEKLLRLAKDESATEGEVENALNFARKMMDQNNLNLSLEDFEDISNSNPSTQVNDIHVEKRSIFHPWMRQTAIAVAEAFDCKVYFIRGYKNSREYRFVGIGSDPTTAKEMYKAFIISIRALARMKYGSKWKASVHGLYALGFAKGLMDQLQEYRHNTYGSYDYDKASAIVLVKKNVIQKWTDSNLGLRRSTRKARTLYGDSNAYNKGREDAAKVKIRQKAIDK